MADAGIGGVPPNVAQGTMPQDFTLKSDLQLDRVDDLLKHLDNGGSVNGAKFNWNYFESDQFKTSDIFTVNLNADNLASSQIDDKAVVKILRAIGTHLSKSPAYISYAQVLDKSGQFTAKNGKPFSFYNLLATGDSEANTDLNYQKKDDHLIETVEWLKTFIEEYTKNEVATSEKTDPTIPDELKRLIGQDLTTSSWNLVFTTVIAPLKAAPINTAPILDAYPDRRLPVFRTFLSEWVEALFKTTNEKHKLFYDQLTDKQKKDFTLDPNFIGGVIPENKNAADAEVLDNLFEKFKLIADGILGLKNPDEVMKPFTKDRPAAEGGGGEADDSRQDEPQQPTVIPDTVTFDEAVVLLKTALVNLIYQQFNFEQLITNEFTNRNVSAATRDLILLYRQIKIEIELQLIDQLKLDAILKDPQLGLYNAAASPTGEENTVNFPAFNEWLKTAPAQILGTISAEKYEKAIQSILQTVFQFADISDDKKVAEGDQTTKKLGFEALQKLIQEHEGYLQKEFGGEDNQDFFTLESGAFDTKFRQSTLFLNTERRFENILLHYLRNQGLTELVDINSIDPQLRSQFKEEIDVFLMSLTRAERLQLLDPAFASQLALRFNRQILLGRFNSSTLLPQLHKYAQDALVAEQQKLKTSVDQITGENQLLTPASKYSAEYIDGMTLEQFNKEFGTNATAPQLARYKAKQIQKWQASYKQSAIIQRLILLYGDDFDFIRALNTADRFNQIFGLQLPNQLSAEDIKNLQDLLINYWQLEITKQRNERNLLLNSQFAKAEGLDQLDAEDARVKAFIAQQLQRRSLATPLLGGDHDYENELQDPRFLAATADLYRASAQIDGLNQLYLMSMAQEQLNAIGLKNRWQLSLQLQAQQNFADVMAAQIAATNAYNFEAIQKQGLLSQFNQRFRGQLSPQQQAKNAMAQGASEAALRAAGMANPMLGGLLKASDTIKSLTGLDRNQQIAAAVGLTAAAIMNLVYQMSKLGGMIGGIVGGVVALPFGPGAVALAIPTGAYVGNVVADMMGINRSLLDFGGSGSAGNALPKLADAAASLPKASLPSPAFGNVAGTVTGSLVAITTAFTLISTTVIQSSMLHPEQLDLSEVVRMTKTIEQPRYSETPQPITYTITLAPIEGAVVTITSASDEMAINYNQKVRDINRIGGGNPNPPASTEYDAIKAQIQSELVGQVLPAEGLSFEYTIPFEGDQYQHAKIINTFTITYDAVVQGELGPENVTNQRSTATISVCFGECPNADGCFNFADPPLDPAVNARITGASTNTQALPWDEAAKQRVADAFAKRAGTSTTFTGLACRFKGQAEDSPITVYRLEGFEYGGWTMSGSEIGLYELAFKGDEGLEYTLIHELGHIINHRNSGLLNGLLGTCLPTYPASCNPTEPFAEAVALFVVYPTYSFSRGIGQFDFPNGGGSKYSPTEQEMYQEQYKYVRDNVFTDKPSGF